MPSTRRKIEKLEWGHKDLDFRTDTLKEQTSTLRQDSHKMEADIASLRHQLLETARLLAEQEQSINNLRLKLLTAESESSSKFVKYLNQIADLREHLGVAYTSKLVKTPTTK